MTSLFMSLVLAIGMGCASKILVLQVPVVSMQKKDTSRESRLGARKTITSTWCAGDLPVADNDDATKGLGMIDQVILLAHQQHQVDYFVDAKVFQKSKCAYFEAHAAELISPMRR